MDKMKIVSIIIPTYNMEKYLRKCLNSLILEDEGLMDYVEVLVINDGSKDSSLSIAREFENGFPKSFRVIDKENGNYGSCINRGLKEAQGKYVKVLDADDYFDNNAFSTYVGNLKTLDVDLVITDFRTIYEDGEVDKNFTFGYPQNKTLNMLDYYRSEDFFKLQMHGVTYRLQIFKDLNYKQTEGVSYTDQQWIFLPFEKVEKFYYLPVILYDYLIGREGQTMASDVFIKSIPQLMKANIDRIKMYEDYHLYESKKEWFFTEKLLRAMQSLYWNVLIVSDTSIDKLRDFDDDVSQISKSFYVRMDDIRLVGKLPIKFIKLWRKKNKKNFSILRKFFYKSLQSIYLYVRRGLKK